MRTLAAAAVVVAVTVVPLVGCSLDTSTDDGLRTGIMVAPGTTAVVGLGHLDRERLGLSADAGPVTLTALTVDGERIGDPAGQVLGVRVHETDPGGEIGAMTTDDLDHVDGGDDHDGWDLLDPAGVVLADAPLGVVVLVRGREQGSWSSDTLVVRFEEDGDSHEERITIGAGLCVVRDPTRSGPCDPLADIRSP